MDQFKKKQTKPDLDAEIQLAFKEDYEPPHQHK